MNEGCAHTIAETVARTSYGRLVAYLSSRSRDIAGAEDALAEAFRIALETWPRRGIPANPEAWLLTAARRTLSHARRHDAVRSNAQPALALLGEESLEWAPAALPDKRLNLLFVCAHPSIDPDIRTPLMLQTVLGIDATDIAQAFLVAPSTMAQRLVRAKAKIKAAGIFFELPDRDDLAERTDAVLHAIYAAYGTGWDDVSGADGKRKGLAEEALFLGRLIVELLPSIAEARGLLALMLYCEARQSARRAADGSFVPLGLQNTGLWSSAMIEAAEAQLLAAAQSAQLGRFQLEAAIQSVHAQRARTGRTEWRALMLLYDLQAAGTPAAGVLVSRAAAYGEGAGADAGLRQLDAMDREKVRTYQPYWAARADLLAKAGRAEEAHIAYEQAIGLAEDQSIKRFLRHRQARLLLD